jgi:hypothetical protein
MLGAPLLARRVSSTSSRSNRQLMMRALLADPSRAESAAIPPTGYPIPRFQHLPAEAYDELATAVAVELAGDMNAALMSAPVEEFICLFCNPPSQDYLRNCRHIELLVRIFLQNLPEPLLHVVLVSMLSIVDGLEGVLRIEICQSVIGKCELMGACLVEADHEEELSLIFQLMSRCTKTREVGSVIGGFLGFTGFCISEVSPTLFSVICDFILSVSSSEFDESEGGLRLEALSWSLVSRIAECDEIVESLGVLFLLLKNFEFPECDLRAWLYGYFEEMVMIGLFECVGDRPVFVALEILESLWARKAIPLFAREGCILRRLEELCGEGGSFAVRHKASVIACGVLRDFHSEIAEMIDPSDIFCLCFELFCRMGVEHSSDRSEQLVAVECFCDVSRWYQQCCRGPSVTEMMSAEDLVEAIGAWEGIEEEGICMTLNQIKDDYEELLRFEEG